MSGNRNDTSYIQKIPFDFVVKDQYICFRKERYHYHTLSLFNLIQSLLLKDYNLKLGKINYI